jgi:hypothetical protein
MSCADHVAGEALTPECSAFRAEIDHAARSALHLPGRNALASPLPIYLVQSDSRVLHHCNVYHLKVKRRKWFILHSQQQPVGQ